MVKFFIVIRDVKFEFFVCLRSGGELLSFDFGVTGIDGGFVCLVECVFKERGEWFFRRDGVRVVVESL